MSKLKSLFIIASLLFVGASISSCTDKDDQAVFNEIDKSQATNLNCTIESETQKVQTIEDKMKEVEGVER